MEETEPRMLKESSLAGHYCDTYSLIVYYAPSSLNERCESMIGKIIE